mmetsp:Transcript_14235/g.18649  ORF Transcript_14235/g.18649 Transcript_14235/m.18649 type:complete len:237 (+) Transcript_14235:173-883(+)
METVVSALNEDLSTLEASINNGLANPELVAKLQKKLKDCEVEIQLLRVEAEEEELLHSRNEGLRRAAELQDQYLQLRLRFRHLSGKHHSVAEKQVAAERASLFRKSYEENENQHDSKVNAGNTMLEKAKLIDTSKDVTATLRRMKKHIVNEMSRINYAEEMLAEDSDMISQTSSEAKKYSENAVVATATLKSIDYKQRKAAFLGKIGFCIFCCVLAWTIVKRIPGIHLVKNSFFSS